MNTDFRVSISTVSHPKIIKLIRRCGHEAFYNLVRLWTFTAQNKPTGVLSGVDAEDVEIAADWRGEPGVFFQTLIDLRLLDITETGEVAVHDWQKHNGYASYAEERSAQAREAARARWDKKRHGSDAPHDADLCVHDAPHDADLCVHDAPHDADYANSNAPYPYPSPYPDPSPSLKDSPPTPPEAGGGASVALPESEVPEKESGEAEPETPAPVKAGTDCPHQAIIALYHEILPTCPTVRVWSDKSRKQLASRWREDKTRQSLDWWRQVFEDVAQSDFLMGRTSCSSFVFSLDWFVKPSNFAKVVNGNYANRASQNGQTVPQQNQPLTANQRYMLEVAQFLTGEPYAGAESDRKRNQTLAGALPGGRA